MIYLLDTNIISYLIRSRDYALIDRFEATAKQARLGVSAITVAELFYGVHKKASPKLAVAVREFLYPLEKFVFDDSAGLAYGQLRAYLEASGQVIGAHDMLIAANAVSLNATLVTNNVKEFARIPNLTIENWCD